MKPGGFQLKFLDNSRFTRVGMKTMNSGDVDSEIWPGVAAKYIVLLYEDDCTTEPSGLDSRAASSHTRSDNKNICSELLIESDFDIVQYH